MPNPKILRWLDLLAALLARRSPATFLDFARDVPAYLTDGSVAARKPLVNRPGIAGDSQS